MNAPIINGHADASPWSYAETRLRTAGRVISLAPDKLAALTELADGLAGDVRQGFLNGQDVVDRLHEVSDAYGLIAEHGEDKVQETIAAGLERASAPLDVVWSPRPSERGAGVGARGLISRKASEIAPRDIDFLWNGRLARGKHTCIGGEPGGGKSQLTFAIAAAITTGGSWPCDEGRAPIGSIIIMNAEDDADDTIVPRLMAAGADLKRIHIVSAVRGKDGKGQTTFNLQADLDLLEKKINEVGDVVLVIIDPVSSYLGKTDSHKNSEVRGVLEPISEMAARKRVAILSITHFSKANSGATTKALHRFIGSIAFVGAPRAAFAVIEDADNEGRMLFLHAKNNMGAKPQGLAFRLLQMFVDGLQRPVSYVAWDPEPVAITANQALAAEAGTGGKTAKDEAMQFLADILANGPVLQKEVKAAAEGAGLAWATVRRAKDRLGIKPHKAGMDGGWLWGIDRRCSTQPEDAQHIIVSTFEENEHLRGQGPADDGLGIPEFLRRT